MSRRRILVSALGPMVLAVAFVRDPRSLLEAEVVGSALLALVWPLLVWRFRVGAIGTRVLADERARLGAVLVVGLLLVAAWAPLISPSAPDLIGDPVFDRHRPPGPGHWLGTDLLGRDLLSRVIHGARVSLSIAVGSVVLSLSVGTAVGGLAGWRGGWVDSVLMRVTDLALAFPRVFLVLLLVAFTQPSPFWIVVVLGVTGWMGVARLVRCARGALAGIRVRADFLSPCAAGDCRSGDRVLDIAGGQRHSRRVLPELPGARGPGSLGQLGNVDPLRA